MPNDTLRHDSWERSAAQMAELLTEATKDCFPGHQWAARYDGYSYSIQMVGAGGENDKPLTETGVINIGGQNRAVKKVFVDSDDPSTEISRKDYYALARAFASHGILSTEDRRDPSREYPVRFLITAFKSHHPNIRPGVRLSDDISKMTTDIQWLDENKDKLRRSVFSHTRGFAFYRRKITSPVTRRIDLGRHHLWKARNSVRSIVNKVRQSTFSGPK